MIVCHYPSTLTNSKRCLTQSPFRPAPTSSPDPAPFPRSRAFTAGTSTRLRPVSPHRATTRPPPAHRSTSGSRRQHYPQTAGQAAATLRSRVRYQFRGYAYGSTLRLTLGSLLGQQLDIQLRQAGDGQRITFGDDEAVLSEEGRPAPVCWAAHPNTLATRSRLIQNLLLPLNLDRNKHSAFHAELSAAAPINAPRHAHYPLEPFDFAAGGGVVGAGVLLGDVQAAQFGLEPRTSSSGSPQSQICSGRFTSKGACCATTDLGRQSASSDR
jgi:hypothetical protein